MKTNEINYDVIIIGGGLSGLTAGAFLSKKGKKVILLEQHSAVGGLASGFTRKGYYFDAAMSKNIMELFQGIWEELGIVKKVIFKEHKASFLVNGRHFSYTDLKSAFDELGNSFPEEREGIEHLYQDQIRKMETFTQTIIKMGFPDMYSGLKKFQYFFRFCSKLPQIGLSNLIFSIKAMSSLRDDKILKKYLNENGKAYAFLMSLIGSHGTSFFYIPTAFIAFISYSYPSCGFQGLSDELANIITFNSENVIKSAPVKQIIIENHTAIGVEYRHKDRDERIFAKKIISAIDLKKSFFQLIGEHHLDNEFCEKLRKGKMSESVPIIYLGLNISPGKIRKYLYGNPELIYAPDITIIRENPMRWDSYYPIRIFWLNLSAVHNPLHAPRNKSNLHIQLPAAPGGWMNNWGIKDGKRTDEYKQIKEKIINQVLNSLEKVIPPIKDRSLIEVCELATPYTTERYTGNTDGSGMGFSKNISDVHTRINGSALRFFRRYKRIRNLYFIGHQTGMNGMRAAMLSAKNIIGKI